MLLGHSHEHRLSLAGRSHDGACHARVRSRCVVMPLRERTHTQLPVASCCSFSVWEEGSCLGSSFAAVVELALLVPHLDWSSLGRTPGQLRKVETQQEEEQRKQDEMARETERQQQPKQEKVARERAAATEAGRNGERETEYQQRKQEKVAREIEQQSVPQRGE